MPATKEQQTAIAVLIQSSTGLSTSEKEYWLSMLPTMNEQHLVELQGILQTEEKNLQGIDQKYDKKLRGVAQKYLTRWDVEKHRAEKMKSRKEESAQQEEAEVQAEELLKAWTP